MSWLPLRIRYWLVWDKSEKAFFIRKCRFNPHYSPADSGWGIVTIDGPFDSQEETLEALSLWSKNLTLESEEKAKGFLSRRQLVASAGIESR